ncbi:MAG: hypothetical protein GY943_11375 [Chloroflexi bacterium]|nr:hypothetical protein [Chloroflexota bacterium]
MTENQSNSGEDSEHTQFIELNTHSFILKFRLIEPNEAQGEGKWCGYLTHVASEQRVYFDNLLEMQKILIPYLRELGIKLPFWWRAYQWLTQ